MSITTTSPSERLQRLRLQNGMTQADMGRLLGGYSHAAVSYWESGYREIPPAVRLLLRVLEHNGPDALKAIHALGRPDE